MEAAPVYWSQREPAPWLMRGFGWLQLLLALAGYALLFGYGARAAAVFWGQPWHGVLIGVVLGYLVVALHELGHVLGARVTGMHVVHAHVGWWQFTALRHGWKSRWAAPAWNVDGAVQAFPRSGHPLRVQEAWLTAGGPLANLATAAVAGLLAWALWRSGWGWLFAALAAQSAAVGLANLVPSNRGLPNDGLQLWRLAKGRDESDPEAVLPMLNGLCMEGTTADQLPEALLDRLRQQPQPPAMVLLWFALFARVHRGEWAQAADSEGELDATLAALPDKDRAAWSPLTGVMRTLACIAAALDTGAASKPLDRHLPPDYDWFHPSLRMICRAAEAALAGDVAARDAWLARAAREAERVKDGATRKTQRKLGDAIRARVGEPSAVPFHPLPATRPHRPAPAARALRLASSAVHVVVVFACLLAGMIGGVFLSGIAVGSPIAGVAVAALLAMLVVPVVCLHSLGVYLAARVTGTPLFVLAVGPVELCARRKGWRVRLRPFTRWFLPEAVAGLAPGRPERRALLALALGGVAVGGVASACFLALALSELPGAMGWFWLCLAGPAAAFSLGSLVPGPGAGSAGAQILRALRPTPADQAQLALMRLRGLTASGQAPDAWPDAALRALSELPAPGPLLAPWVEVGSALTRGDWGRADDVGARLPSLLAAGPSNRDTESRLLQESLQVMRRIAGGLAGRTVEAPLDARFLPGLEWRMPWLLRLAEAMDAARAGDAAARDRALAGSERLAADEPDGLLRRLEVTVRGGIAGMEIAMDPTERHAGLEKAGRVSARGADAPRPGEP